MNQDGFFIVGCGHCGARNRIPQNKMHDHPICGKCRTPLAVSGRYPEKPIDADDGSFSAEVLSFPGPVVVFFWAPWCGYCQRMLPIVNELAGEFSGRLKFVKVLLERAPSTASRYAVQSVPTILLVRNGKQVDRINGALPEEEFRRRLNQLR